MNDEKTPSQTETSRSSTETSSPDESFTRRDSLKTIGGILAGAGIAAIFTGIRILDTGENINLKIQEPLREFANDYAPEVWQRLAETGLWNKSPFHNPAMVDHVLEETGLITNVGGEPRLIDGNVKLYTEMYADTDEVNPGNPRNSEINTVSAGVEFINLPNNKKARTISVATSHIMPGWEEAAEYYRKQDDNQTNDLTKDQQKEVMDLLKDIRKSLHTMDGRSTTETVLYQEEVGRDANNNIVWETKMLPNSIETQVYMNFLLKEGVIGPNLPIDLSAAGEGLNKVKQQLQLMVQKIVIDKLVVNAKNTTEEETQAIIENFITPENQENARTLFVNAKQYYASIKEGFHHLFLDKLQDDAESPPTMGNESYWRKIVANLGVPSAMLMPTLDLEFIDAKKELFEKNFEKIPEKPKAVYFVEYDDDQTKVLVVYEDKVITEGIGDRNKELFSNNWTEVEKTEALINDTLDGKMAKSIGQDGSRIYSFPLQEIRWFAIQNNFAGSWDQGKDPQMRVATGLPWFGKDGEGGKDEERILLFGELLENAFDYNRSQHPQDSLRHPDVTEQIEVMLSAGEDHFHKPSLLSYKQLMERMLRGIGNYDLNDLENSDDPAWAAFAPTSEWLRTTLGMKFSELIMDDSKKRPEHARLLHALGNNINIKQISGIDYSGPLENFGEWLESVSKGAISILQDNINETALTERDGETPVQLMHGDWVPMLKDLLHLNGKDYIVIAVGNTDDGWLTNMWKEGNINKLDQLLVIDFEEYKNATIAINPDNAFVNGVKDLLKGLAVLAMIAPMIAPAGAGGIAVGTGVDALVAKTGLSAAEIGLGASVDSFYLAAHNLIRKMILAGIAGMGIPVP